MMPNRSRKIALFPLAGLVAAAGAFTASADGELSIDADALQSCFGSTSCLIDGATISTTGGSLAKKVDKGETAFGVSGGASGAEIDALQKVRVDYADARSIIAIKVVFLYNGPEFNDRAEKARIHADGVEYLLSVRNNVDDADAIWSGPGNVDKCGATTAAGSGCFVITNPFPGAVSRLDFTTATGDAPFAGAGTNPSDYSIAFIDAAAQVVVDLGESCAELTGCPVASVGGQVGASVNSVEATNLAGSLEVEVNPVRFPDCRYIPQVCVDLLPPAGDSASNDNAARSILIGLGVIKSLVSWGSDKLNPATQLLNVTPLLPIEVTSQFDTSGKPPTGLPRMYIGPRWRGQSINDYWIDALFFKTDPDVVFSDNFEMLIDVEALAGDELGCITNLGDLFAWDMVTALSELAPSVSLRHADRLGNVGCINPSKVSGERLSLYSFTLEAARDTYGPTIKSRHPKVTLDNDAVFARLVQSLWFDLGEIKARYACKATDSKPPGTPAPFSKSLCSNLHSLWESARSKINACVDAAFYPASAYRDATCASAKSRVAAFEAALPAAATGPDPFNRRSELEARVDVFQHVWDERFLNSLKPLGYCREKGTC